MTTPTEPLDDAHTISRYLTDWIRADIAAMRAEAATWEPAPPPPPNNKRKNPLTSWRMRRILNT